MYRNYSDSEILAILDQIELYTFPSQLALKQELDLRQLNVNSLAYENLVRLTHVRTNEIEEFKYLDKLGFQLQFTDEGYKITRTTKAIIIDILAVLIGAKMLHFGILGLGNFFVLLSGAHTFEFGPLFRSSLFLIAGYFGILILINGITRLIDYAGFQFTKEGQSVALNKRIDFNLEVFTGKASQLVLKKQNNGIDFMLDNHIIFSVRKPNLESIMTIKSLATNK